MPDASRSETNVLSTLNKAQCRAVTSKAATVAILAGPGSGKTHTLTSRVAWLIEEQGYQPCDIIVATFTVKAAREMKDRIGRALRDGREKGIVLGTFHSIARRYLAKYGKHIGLDPKFSIADDGDSRAIIARICKRDRLTCDPPSARSWISKQKAKGTLSEKATGSQSATTLDFQKCYDSYQDHLKTGNLLDYDDLLVLGVALLRQNPSCVSNVQAVLIDEYQDTNGVQYDLMKLLAQARSRITVVGDPDQSIYGWRSAEIRNLYRLLHEFPNTEEVALEENYRSSHYILHSSLEVIRQDSNRYKKVLLPVHTKGTKPVLRRLVSQPAEAAWVVSEIKRILLLSGNMVTHDNMAILLRSASLSRHLESALGKAGIPYRMVGGFKFYERAEIKTLIDYLRVVYQPDSNDALARIINVPKRGIGDGTIKTLLEEAETNRMTLWTLLVKHCRGTRTARTNIRKDTEAKFNIQVIRIVEALRESLANSTEEKPFTLVELINELVERIEFKRYLEDTYPEQHEQRWANVEEFMSLASDFLRSLTNEDDEILPNIEGLEQTQDTDPLARFLANVSLAADVQKNDTNDLQEPKPMVTISTIHAAKGLEWPVVFIPAAYNGSIPHARSDDQDEERRLLFVAMTRAKALLYLSCPKKAQGESSSEFELSSFLEPVSSQFAQKGPSLDRKALEEIGRIIGRGVPSDAEIYGNMPQMMSLEDDRFPVQPYEEAKAGRRYDADPYDDFHQYQGDGDKNRGYKRQKRSHAMNGNGGQEGGGEDMGYPNFASTTMEERAGFTMAGFTTAGAHHTALEASGRHSEAPDQQQQQAKKPAATKPKLVGPNKRPANQPSLMGFLKGSSSKQQTKVTAPAALPAPAQVGRQSTITASSTSNTPRPWIVHSTTQPKSTKPPIAPELASHKLAPPRVAAAAIPRNTTITTAAAAGTRPTGAEESLTRHPSYGGCFSSSPIRAGGGDFSAEKENRVPPVPLTPQLRQGNTARTSPTSGTSSNISSRGTGSTASREPPSNAPTAAAPIKGPQGLPGAGPLRPVGLHGGGGFRRPAGMGAMGREGDVKALERLKRPFRTPSMRSNTASITNGTGGGGGSGMAMGMRMSSGGGGTNVTIGNATTMGQFSRKT